MVFMKFCLTKDFIIFGCLNYAHLTICKTELFYNFTNFHAISTAKLDMQII